MAKGKYQYSIWRIFTYYAVHSHAFLSAAFILAVAYSFLYHVWFLKIPGVFTCSYDVGVWFSVLIEGLIIGIIIYYITVLYPLKRKRILLQTMLHNNISRLFMAIREIFDKCGYPIQNPQQTLNKPESGFELSCKLETIPNKNVVIISYPPKMYPTLSFFVFEKLDELVNKIHELYFFQDALDTETLSQLSLAENSINQLNFYRSVVATFDQLSIYGQSLFETYEALEKALKIFSEKNDTTAAINMHKYREKTRMRINTNPEEFNTYQFGTVGIRTEIKKDNDKNL